MIAVRTATAEAAEALANLRSIFLDQVNAKDLAILGSTDDFPGTIVVAKPDPAAIGKTYKGLAPKIVKLLAQRPADESRRALERGAYTVQRDGQTLSIEPSMVRLEKALPADVARVETPHGEVYLDLRVTPELQAEAYARELIRRIQQMRQDLDLDVDDFIATVIKTDKEFSASLELQSAFIARETRSRSLAFTDKSDESERVVEWKDLDGDAAGRGRVSRVRLRRVGSGTAGDSIPSALRCVRRAHPRRRFRVSIVRRTSEAPGGIGLDRGQRRRASAAAEGLLVVPRAGGDAGGGVPSVPNRAEGGQERNGLHAAVPTESPGTLRPLRPPGPVAQQRREGGHNPTERPRKAGLGRGTVPLPRTRRGPVRRHRILGDKQQLPDGPAPRAGDPGSSRREQRGPCPLRQSVDPRRPPDDAARAGSGPGR